ncbi:hypothetical protein [Patulibacter minatonensis]|uniref:hypothetical protein n=1 Tax=Patulibacter minatonensis TaxID=298163 RepID=UPI00047A2AA8|nr:hypothetical protein [Patulibacter minatonensis]
MTQLSPAIGSPPVADPSRVSARLTRWRVAAATLFTLLVVGLSAGAGSAHAASAEVTPDTWTEGSVRVTVTPSPSSKYRADISVKDIRGRAVPRACSFTDPLDCIGDVATTIWNGIKWVKRNGLNIVRCSAAVAVAIYPGAKVYKFAKKLGGPKGVVKLIAASRNEGTFVSKLKGKLGKNWKDAATSFLGIAPIELYCFGKKP